MTEVIAHRGPDGSGEYIFANVALGHRRLAIIDLTDDGRQPMIYGDGRFVLTFNGEIYNYLELRKELMALGHVFRSSSDSEVILAAYAQWGEDCVNRFNGMWAFAILDRDRKRLFCSRDRFGVKPFYFVDLPDVFAFGSEIRQLLPLLPRIEARRDLLSDFLLTSIADHTDGTFFSGVSKLPAGHNLEYDLASARHCLRRYYRIRRRTDLALLPDEEAMREYVSVLEDAVRLRLRADVPVGTCLSGGLDSSTVASLAAPSYQAEATQPFCAITAVSEQESNNEACYAREVAEAAGLAWFTVRPTYDDFVDSLPKLVSAQEEPFGSTSLTMQYFVMQTARNGGIPVLLDGQGGDETLLGYEKYFGSYLATTFREHGVGALCRAFASARANNSKMSLKNAAKYLIGGLVSPARYLVYLHQHRYLAERPPFPEYLADFARASRDVFALQELEITRTNLPVLLRYEDKNSMAHSIEARLPFLDYRAVEAALSLPGRCKIRDGWTKWVLRKGMQGRMPESIVWRKNKFGFEAPENLWMGRHAIEMRDKVLASPLLGELARRRDLRDVFPRLGVRGQWRLYSVSLWEEAFGVSG